MNSYEIIKRAIEFRTPRRIPVEFGSLGQSDTHWVTWNQIGAGDVKYKESLDEWGCLWVRTGVSNMGQVKGHPLYDWSLMDKFKWPEPDNPRFYEGMEDKFMNSEGKYILTNLYQYFFERLHTLRGFENALTDLYLERENIEKLADRIVEFNIEVINNISNKFPNMIHGLWVTDDWGSELSTFISKSLWDEFFKPRYLKISAAVKNAGWHLWMHSCGKINDFIDGFIESGVNVLNLQQPRALGIEEIGKKYAGKVCFSTTCDIQKTLPFKDEKEIYEEAGLLINCWGTDKGGLIASEYGDGAAIGVSSEKKALMFDAFITQDRWKKNLLRGF